MAIISEQSYTGDGSQREFQVNGTILSESHIGVWFTIDGVDYRQPTSSYDVLGSVVLFETAPEDGTYIRLLLSDSGEDLDVPPSAVTDVSLYIGNINNVSDNIVAINSNHNNMGDINTVAGNTANINILAGDTLAINTLASIETELLSIYGDRVKITSLYNDKAKLDSLFADKATLDGLFSSKTAIDSLYSIKAKLDSLYADKATLDSLYAYKSKLDDIYANITKIVNLHNNMSKISNLDTNMPKISNVDSNMTALTNINSNMAEILQADTNAQTATTKATEAQLSTWEAEARKMTADSYATEPEDVYVKVYTSNGNGTFTATNTTEYSSLHWAIKAQELVAGGAIDDTTHSLLKTYSSTKIQALHDNQQEDIHGLIQSILNLQTSNAQGQFASTSTISLSTIEQVMPFNVVTQSTDTNIFEITNGTGIVKQAGTYSFISTVDFEDVGANGDVATVTFNLRDTTTNQIYYTQSRTIEISNFDRETIPFNSLLVIPDTMTFPIEIDINVVCTQTGYNIVGFNSITSSQGGAIATIDNIDSALGNLVTEVLI